MEINRYKIHQAEGSDEHHHNPSTMTVPMIKSLVHQTMKCCCTSHPQPNTKLKRRNAAGKKYATEPRVTRQSLYLNDQSTLSQPTSRGEIDLLQCQNLED